jgi:hypothetical protein
MDFSNLKAIEVRDLTAFLTKVGSDSFKYSLNSFNTIYWFFISTILDKISSFSYLI